MPDSPPDVAAAKPDAPRIEHAAPDGLPLYIGYGALEVLSPDGRHRTRWLYDREPPHGDSLNRVWLDGIELPGRYWGRGHAWSPSSPDPTHPACFTVERLDAAGRSALYLVRASDRHWLRIAEQAMVVSLRHPEIAFRHYGEARPVQTARVKEPASWTRISAMHGADSDLHSGQMPSRHPIA